MAAMPNLMHTKHFGGATGLVAVIVLADTVLSLAVIPAALVFVL